MMNGAFTVGDVQLEHFRAQLDARGGALAVCMSGNADQEARTSLQRIVAALDDEARRAAAREVTLDVRDLYFMNSSCLAILMRWTTDVLKRAEGERYRVRFVCNPNLRWQRRSLHALAMLGQGIVVVE